jgi:VCBS repeat-containing protein
MSEDKTDIRYFTAEEDDDFISGWYRVVDGRRIGDPLDTPPLPPALFSPAASAPVSPSFSGIFRQGIYADPSLGFDPFAQFDDIKVQVSQEISILNPITDPAEDVSITIKDSKVHRVKVESTSLFSSTFIDDPRGTVEKKGHYGTLLFIPDDPEGASSGEWVYTLERRSRRVLDLNEGDTRKDFFTLVYGDVEELVVITVTGANDPFFFDEKSGYQFVVTEGIEIGTVLGKPTGRDPEGDTPRFQIVGGNEDGLFHINPVSGWITVVGEIDFETTPYTSSYIGQFEYRNHFYNLQVEVSDGIAPPAQTTINIPVRDIDDTPPVIASSQTTAHIPSGVAGFVTDIAFTYTDVDTVFEGLDEIKWRISGDQADKFKVYRNPLAYSDGFRLQLKYLGGSSGYAELDYDSGNELHLTVQGVDLQGNVSEPLSIIVYLTQQNLHTPKLTVAGTGVITEKLTGQDTGITFSITDLDADGVNRFSFNILDGNSRLFEVVDIGGVWTLKAKDGVSFDARDARTINVQVNVSDSVNTSNIETITIKIVPVDEGDARFFIANEQSLREAPDVGTVLTALRGKDDPDGHKSSSTIFEWFHIAAPDDIIGTGRRYTITESDIGHQIQFRAIYLDGDGTVEIVTSNAAAVTGVVTAAVTTGAKSDTGDARFYISNVNQAREEPTPGTELRALKGRDDPDGHMDGPISYQWFHINAPEVVIGRQKTYTVTNDDIGHRIMFRAYYLDGDGKAETVLANTPSISGVVTATGYKNTLIASTTTASIPENDDGFITDITLRLRDYLFSDLKLTEKDFIITAHGGISDIDKSNPANLFDIVNLNGAWTLKLKDGVSLNFEETTSYAFTVTINNIVNSRNENLPSNTITINLNVINVDENAVIEIQSPHPETIQIGDTLTVNLISEDDHGLHASPNIAYTWFYASDPDTAIGTGDSYIVKEADRGENIGVERSYTDKLNNLEKVEDILEIAVPRVEISAPPPPPTPSPSAPTIPIDRTITIAPQTASKVVAGDGADTITDGNRNDIIIGGKGDDKIDLGHNQEGKDQDQVIYGIGDKSAKDGGDIITNFNRGRDSFIFSLEANSATNAIDSLDDFLMYVMSGTPEDVSDDQLLVVLNLSTPSQGQPQLVGVSFHFQDSVSFGGGRIAVPVVKVQFSVALDQQAIIAALGGDMQSVQSAMNSDGILTNLDYLDDLMGGEGSIGYQIDMI